MDVIEAMLARRSTRDFTPDPVARETVLKILEMATHAPSSGNYQPWEIFVAGGPVLEKLRQSYLDRFEKNLDGKQEIDSAHLAHDPPVFQERAQQMYVARWKLRGLDPKDEVATRRAGRARSSRFFGAPVLIILCMNRLLSRFTLFDLGLLTQNILLAAQNFGIASIISPGCTRQPDILRQELAIPDDLVIAIGIVLGYADKQSRENTYRSPRRPIQEVVTVKGL